MRILRAAVQPFDMAIAPLEDTRSAGRIFWDLLGTPGMYAGSAVRADMTNAGLSGYGEIVVPAPA